MINVVQKRAEITESDDDDETVHEDIETPKVINANKIKVAMGRELLQVCGALVSAMTSCAS